MKWGKDFLIHETQKISDMKSRHIRVLVVDDSAFMRKALKRMLNSDPMIRVVGDAKEGRECLEKVKELKPDVITLDVRMPGMDGIEVLEKIMEEAPTPVLMISSLTSEGGELTLKALEVGAVDFIDKSSCHTTFDILEIAETLVTKVKVIAGVDVRKVVETKPPPPTPFLISHPPISQDHIPSHIVAIGASTGGPLALENVLVPLPANYSGAILVVQHMPAGFTRSLAERLDKSCAIEVKEAEEGDSVLPGRIYIAPGGYHMKLNYQHSQYCIALDKTPLDTPHRPSVDVMMTSVAQFWHGSMLGIIMTGMGADGVEGIREMKKRGATIIAQDESSCVVFGMPRAAFLSGYVDRMIPLASIANEICKFEVKIKEKVK